MEGTWRAVAREPDWVEANEDVEGLGTVMDPSNYDINRRKLSISASRTITIRLEMSPEGVIHLLFISHDILWTCKLICFIMIQLFPHTAQGCKITPKTFLPLAKMSNLLIQLVGTHKVLYLRVGLSCRISYFLSGLKKQEPHTNM